eukprot:5484724-Pyramimonas_sp.AAC.1
MPVSSSSPPLHDARRGWPGPAAGPGECPASVHVRRHAQARVEAFLTAYAAAGFPDPQKSFTRACQEGFL